MPQAPSATVRLLEYIHAPRTDFTGLIMHIHLGIPTTVYPQGGSLSLGIYQGPRHVFAQWLPPSVQSVPSSPPASPHQCLRVPTEVLTFAQDKLRILGIAELRGFEPLVPERSLRLN